MLNLSSGHYSMFVEAKRPRAGVPLYRQFSGHRTPASRALAAPERTSGESPG